MRPVVLQMSRKETCGKTAGRAAARWKMRLFGRGDKVDIHKSSSREHHIHYILCGWHLPTLQWIALQEPLFMHDFPRTYSGSV